MNYFIGVDVGTGSVRAGLFDSKGVLYKTNKKDITTWSYENIYKEQSSIEIWENICEVVRKTVKESNIKKEDIKGIGFDATCSLVALDKDENPVSLSKSGEKNQNIILWMDHRAKDETDFINKTEDKVLEFVGGKISIEMEIPKLLWVKKNLKENYEKIKYFFDLPDFLVFKATGKPVRSLCSLGCKWNYLNHEKRWDDQFFKKIGLDDIVNNQYSTIGEDIKEIGEKAGKLSEKAAKELGLNEDVQVGVSMIDAHAGGLGVIGIDDGEERDFQKRLALIGGTSSCHMAVGEDMVHATGIWGPYFGAMLPNMWLLEGGQSATGALVDFVIKTHVKHEELKKIAKENNRSVYEELNIILEKMSFGKDIDTLTEDYHILPYFMGNRSPRSNPDLRGVISGLTMDESLESLALKYLATIQSVAYGTRHIIEVLNNNGFSINKIFMTGGGTKNKIFLKSHANVTGCKIILGKEEESVLLGASILGAVAAGEYKDIFEGMKNMSNFGKIIEVNKTVEDYHNRKYKVFKKMYEDFLTYKNIMEN